MFGEPDTPARDRDSHRPTVGIRRDAGAVMIEVDAAITGLLGWVPSDLIGEPSTNFIHPLDQGSAVQAWMDMLVAPGASSAWKGRYRASNGRWVWVETENTNRLEEPGAGFVATTMRAAEAAAVTVEEALREREQLLAKIADAIPVGLAQFDVDRRLVFANDQLHDLLGRPDAATMAVLFEGVSGEDRVALDAALGDTLSGRQVEDLELSCRVDGVPRSLELAMRMLVGASGEVSGGIVCVHDVTDSAMLRRQLERRAATDGLTGCANREAIIAVLEQALARLPRAGSGVALLYLDLDGFKVINDSCGHGCGDHVLVSVAGRMRAAIRGLDRVGRFGGDEFLVVCHDVSDLDAAAEVAERVVRGVAHRVHFEGEVFDIRASVGVAHTTEPVDPDALIARADEAMYEIKRDRRRRS